MRIPTLSAIALATLLATGGVANAQAGGAGSVTPVTEFPLVKVDITILDAAGTTVKTLSCEWTEPQEDDRPCLRFQRDPQIAFEAIEEAGGVRTEKHTTSDGLDMNAVYSKRADGTWLIRSKGTVRRQADALRVRVHRRRPEVRALGRRRCQVRAQEREGRGRQAAASGSRYRAAATTAGVTPAMPRAFGWNGAAALPGTSGSTQRVPEPLHASLPRLAV